MNNVLRAIIPIVIAFSAAVAISSCTEAQIEQIKRDADKLQRLESAATVHAGRYVQDKRTGLCFLSYDNGIASNRVISFTNVPCSEPVLAQIHNKPESGR